MILESVMGGAYFGFFLASNNQWKQGTNAIAEIYTSKSHTRVGNVEQLGTICILQEHMNS